MDLFLNIVLNFIIFKNILLLALKLSLTSNIFLHLFSISLIQDLLLFTSAIFLLVSSSGIYLLAFEVLTLVRDKSL